MAGADRSQPPAGDRREERSLRGVGNLSARARRNAGEHGRVADWRWLPRATDLGPLQRSSTSRALRTVRGGGADRSLASPTQATDSSLGPDLQRPVRLQSTGGSGSADDGPDVTFDEAALRFD